MLTCLFNMEKKKGIIEIGFLESKQYPFSVSFWGHNEGSSCPCENEEEVKREVASLLSRHRGRYEIVVKDKRIVQKTL